MISLSTLTASSGEWCVQWWVMCPVVSDVSSGMWCVQWYVMCPVVSGVSSGEWCVQWCVMCPVVCDVSSGEWCVQWWVVCPVVSDVSSGEWCVQWWVMCPVVSDVSSGEWCVQWWVVCPVVSDVSSGEWCVQWWVMCPVVSGVSSGEWCVQWWVMCPVVSSGQVRCCLLQEQPQLEHDRSHLLQLIANDQMVLRDLEDKSLSLLQKSQGRVNGLWQDRPTVCVTQNKWWQARVALVAQHHWQCRQCQTNLSWFYFKGGCGFRRVASDHITLPTIATLSIHQFPRPCLSQVTSMMTTSLTLSVPGHILDDHVLDLVCPRSHPWWPRPWPCLSQVTSLMTTSLTLSVPGHILDDHVLDLVCPRSHPGWPCP